MKHIGISFDDPWKTDAIVAALKQLPSKPMVRVIFDSEITDPSEYRTILEQIKPHATIMGELLDSEFVKNFSQTQFEDRAKAYHDELHDVVDLWEINEINGDWLGEGAAQKFQAVHKLLHGRGAAVMGTFYWTPDEFWERWSLDNIPYLMGSTLDVVAMSIYPDDNEDKVPDFDSLFKRMGQLFPNSRLMVGEFGPGADQLKHVSTADRMKNCREYWTRDINHERFDGSILWYGSQYLKASPKELIETMKGCM